MFDASEDNVAACAEPTLFGSEWSWVTWATGSAGREHQLTNRTRLTDGPEYVGRFRLDLGHPYIGFKFKVWVSLHRDYKASL